ncbi:MAG: serine/threonine protein kinase [Pirellulales bacterium]|nr:serine/threonine protein kinase [Pirellulales bacterium]
MTDSSRQAPQPESPAAEPTTDGAAAVDLLRFDQPTVIAQRSPTPFPGVASLSPSDLGKALIGERLGHFELQEYVGGGGMGAVFKALDSQLGRIVALKVLSRDQSSDEELLRRFRNEAQSAARLDHENIARVYFFGEDRGLNFIVFEFIEGVNVRDLIVRHGPLAWPDAVNFTLQIADALAHASSRDVVHRDIKPSNIIITDSRRAKLVDMGLARLHQVQRSEDDLTASGVTLGTFDYISPEQARDPRSADVRSDIYSLGCTLYYMLSGQPPFPDGTVLQKLLQHQGDEPPDPRQFNPEVPTELCAIVRRMLAKDPRRRYQTPAALTADLMALANRFGVAPLERQPAAAPLLTNERSLSFFEQHLPWMAPVAVLLVAVALIEFLPLSADEAWEPPQVARGGRDALAAAPQSGPAAADALPAPINTGKTEGAADDLSRPRVVSPQAANQPATLPPTEQSAVPPSAPAADRAAASANGNADASTNGSEPNSASGELGPAAAQATLTAPGSRAAASLATSEMPSTEPLAPDNRDRATEGQQPLAAESPPLDAPVAKLADSRGADAANASVPEAAAAPPGDAARSTAPAAKRGLLIVSEAENGSNVYPTLSAACRAAKMGDVIELRYHGPKVTRPIQLANQAVTIRAGAGFRPEIVFAPGDAELPRSTTAMISLVGGSLTLVNVAIAWQPPAINTSAAPWTLIEAQAAQAVRLQQCVLTASIPPGQGEAQRPTAFLRVLPPPGGELPVTIGAFFGLEPVVVEFTDCVARGAATLFDVVTPQTATITWDNGLLATSDRLLHIAGEMSATSTREVPIELNLRHVTVAAQRGLVLLESQHDEPFNAQVTCRVKDCILLHAPSAAIVDLATGESKDLQRRRLSWHGEDNFYEGVSTFWRIADAADEDPETYNFRAWQQWWGTTRESQPHWNGAIWRKLPPPDLSFDQQVLDDYALDEAGESNPARSSASDGSDAGFQRSRLSPLVLPGKSAVSEGRGNMGMPPLK